MSLRLLRLAAVLLILNLGGYYCLYNAFACTASSSFVMDCLGICFVARFSPGVKFESTICGGGFNEVLLAFKSGMADSTASEISGS